MPNLNVFCSASFGIMSDSLSSRPVSSGNKARTVYVLDHDARILSEIGIILQSLGIAVRSFRRAEQLLAAPMPDGPACLLLGHEKSNGADDSDIHQNLVDWGWIHPIVYLSSCSEVRSVVAAMKNGACDYLTKPCEPHELMRSILNALDQSNEILLQRESRESDEMKVQCLTKREREVVECVLSGLLNKEIAAKLNLSLVTVKVHRSRAMKKLGAGNAAELVHIASIGGIAQLPQTPPLL